MASPASSLSSPSSSLSPPPSRKLTPPPQPSPPSDISSDTSGSVPGSPVPEDLEFADQVTICRWEGCLAGDLGDMDSLVQHIHDSHIGTRKQKYSCEWEDCGRKGMTHASGYALRAHVRSHTREKPFYCSLPECDRSFTRSDALAKHMRTVHETEALRPSDPIPKGYTADPTTPAPPSRKRKTRPDHPNPTPSPTATRHPNTNGHTLHAPPPSHADGGASSRYWSTEDGLSEDEVQFPPKQLLAYLKQKEAVLEEEARGLRARDRRWSEMERRAWVEKEKCLEEVLVESEDVVGMELRIWREMARRGREEEEMGVDVVEEEREEEEEEERNGVNGLNGLGEMDGMNGISRLLEAAGDDVRELNEDEDGEAEDDDEDVNMDDESS